jgi:hypothetical protein
MKTKINKLIKFGILLLGIPIFLWNCEQENIEISNPQENIQNNHLDFELENLTFSQANNEKTFSVLKTKFKIEEPVYNHKKKKYLVKINNTYSKSTMTENFSDLYPSIDVSVIRKITTPNYVSYTMKVNEPQNSTNSFSNIVIQEANGVQEIFTFRYTPSQSKSKSTLSTSSFEGTYTMVRGMCIPDQQGDCSGNGLDDDSGGGGTGDFVEICYDVTVLIPVGCGCGHMPWQSCQGCNGNYPYYTLETQQECYWDYAGSTGNTGGNNTGSGNNNTGSGGSGSSSGSDGNVITTPIDDIIPDGADPVEWFDKQVFIDDDFKDNPCIKSVYDQMGKASKFQEYLQSFEDNSSVANLRFSADDNFGNNFEDYTSAMAITSPPNYRQTRCV